MAETFPGWVDQASMGVAGRRARPGFAGLSMSHLRGMLESHQKSSTRRCRRRDRAGDHKQVTYDIFRPATTLANINYLDAHGASPE
ncbi:MmpS family transport accessory protein [Mycobacterium europaeum]|uniref:MmpS family transport accessory protein n=1 Tax=Mycobacterium europaeum TaxID=761804 RepID=UPI003D6BEBC0